MKVHSRYFHAHGRARNQGDPQTSANQIQDRKYLAGLLHDSWCEPGAPTEIQYVVVKSFRDRARQENKRLVTEIAEAVAFRESEIDGCSQHQVFAKQGSAHQFGEGY